MDHDLVRAIYTHYEEEEAKQESRGYLGASSLGKPCTRALWYDFRWSGRVPFPGRMLRLFETGHMAEPRFIKNLRDIGATVWAFDPDTGLQFAYADIAGHLRGHSDGVAKDLPGGDGEWHLMEYKTHSTKSFANVVKHGVESAKPEHFVQMMMYMGWAELGFAMYLAVNKDTDELYAERVEFNRDLFESMRNRAASIIFADEPPLRLSNDPTYYQCKFCDHAEVCHGNRVPAQSCRTCVHATPEKEGNARWSCAQHKKESLTIKEQRAACPSHLPLPVLLQYAEPVDGGINYIEFMHKDTGKRFVVVNDDFGDPGQCGPDEYVYFSEEISNAHRGVITNAEHEAVRQIAGGRITG